MRFGFSTDVKVRFAETDAQGIAHHANYLIWFEAARIEYLSRFGGGYRQLQEEGIEALTLDAQVAFRAPARFDDRLTISARCTDVRGARFRFEYRVERDGALIAEGSTGHACADARTLRPTRIPAWLIAEISAAEAEAEESSS